MNGDEQDPEKKLAAIRAKAASDPEAKLAALREPPVSQIHRLAQRPGGMARLKANVADQNAADRQSPLAALTGTATAAAQEIPGVERAGAFLRSKAQGQPYDKALSEMRTAEEETPASLTTAARLGAMAIPGAGLAKTGLSAAKGGALLGGLFPALAADTEDPSERIARIAGGAAMGGVLGKVLESMGVAGRANRAKSLDENLVARGNERAATAGPKYDAFRQLGDLDPASPTGPKTPLQDLMDLPVVRSAINTVKGESPELSKLPDTDARVLGAVYQRVGNKAFKMAQGYETDEARQALLDTIDRAAQAKGGSFAEAVAAFREPSQEMSAVTRGSNVLKNAARAEGTADKKMLTESPAAFREWLKTADPEDRKAAVEGILGRLKQSPKTAKVGLSRLHLPVGPSKRLTAATGLLREADTPFMRLLDIIGGGAGGMTGGTLAGVGASRPDD